MLDLFCACYRLYTEFGLNEPNDFTRFGMATGNFLAEEDGLTRQHFETPPTRGDQLQGANGIRKELQDFARQTEGSRGVVSLHAEFDAQIELVHVASFLILHRLLQMGANRPAVL